MSSPWINPPSGRNAQTFDSPTFTGTPKNVPGVLAEWSVPFLMASSATMGNNGALTAHTTLPRALSKCYIYLPASAISAGSGAGWYYAEFSSTSAATVYNNTYTSGVPRVPASKTAFVTTGPGAFTGATTNLVGPSISVLANSMASNGMLEIEHVWQFNNGVGTKQMRIYLGGTGGTAHYDSGGLTTQVNADGRTRISNAAATNAQVGYSRQFQGAGTPNITGPVTGAIDTTANTTVDFAFFKNGTATDFIILESASVKLLTDGT